MAVDAVVGAEDPVAFTSVQLGIQSGLQTVARELLFVALQQGLVANDGGIVAVETVSLNVFPIAPSPVVIKRVFELQLV